MGSPGDWSQRVGKEKSSNLGDPADGSKVGVVHRPHPRKSEGIVVAGKQGNSCGAKGSYCKSETISQSIPACLKRLRDKTMRLLDGIEVGDDECLQESQMREIRTSGLTRGSNGASDSRPLLSTLLRTNSR